MTFFGVAFSARKGYWEYAFQVRPPPHGFSHASFSSNTTVLTPVEASCAAANAPEGPPPRIATFMVFGWGRPVDVRQAMARRFPPRDVLAAEPSDRARRAAAVHAPAYC